MFQFVYTRCGKHCTNFGVLAKQMKIHVKRKVDSTPLLRFFKRAPAKKIAVIRKPIKNATANQSAGEITGKTTSTFENCNHQFRLSHQKILSLFHQDVSTSDLGHFVVSKSIISFHMEKCSP